METNRNTAGRLAGWLECFVSTSYPSDTDKTNADIWN